MTLYDSNAVEKLVEKYIAKNGNIQKIQDGSLLDYGLAIFFGNNLKTCIVKEQYLNEWSSAYTIRFYNKTPKKYKQLTN